MLRTFYGTALDAIEDWKTRDALRVLDLGAGTGLFSSLLLARFAGSRVHQVDASGHAGTG